MKFNKFVPLTLSIGLVILWINSVSFKKNELEDQIKKKPNIIFLLSDDQRDNTFGAMGHPVLKTPNADKLIKKGVRFKNTYIAAPVCSPSRVSFFTGMYERIHGVGFSTKFQLTEDQWLQTYPQLLRSNGYYSGFVGKFGVEYYTFKGKASEKFDFWSAHDGWSEFWPKELENCKEYADSKEDIITPIMGEKIEEFLDSIPGDKPFSLSVSFSVPHGSQIVSMYPDNELAAKGRIPANEYPKLKGRPFYDTMYRDKNITIPAETGTDPYVNIPKRMLDQSKGRATGTYIYDYSRESCKEHYIRYYQQISGMDKVIGDLMKSMKKKGLSDNTIIIFASDHGLLMGEYGMSGKALLYDMVEKIPCFIYDPRLPKNKKGITVDNLVSSLDITTTILDYAGIEPSANMQGRSLIPLINGTEKEWRKELFLESLFTGRDTPFSEGIRMGDWKYIRMYGHHQWSWEEKDVDFKGKKPEFEQLFNLKNDPQEMHNLISEYEGSKILSELRNKTAKYSEEKNLERKRYIQSNPSAIKAR